MRIAWLFAGFAWISLGSSHDLRPRQSASTTTSPKKTTTTLTTTKATSKASTTTAPSSTASTTSRPANPTSTGLAFCSNSDLTYKLSPIPGPVTGNGDPQGRSTWKLMVDDGPSGHKQIIDGFGAAITDATVQTFNSLSATQLNQLLTELLSSSGAGFSLMRHTIGASDLTGDPPYTYDDMGSVANGPTLPKFNLTSRGTAMALLLARMQSMSPQMDIMGSPWSAPGWMKLNGVIQGNTTQNNLDDGYLTNNGPRSSQAFANYFVAYIRAFQKLGARISSMSLQNEPLNSQAGYPTMYMYDYEQARLVQNYVGPALRNAGLSTSIWAYDHNTDVPSFPQTVLSGAGAYIGAVAWHCYANPLDWTTLTRFREQNPNVKQYMTECWTPAVPLQTWHWPADFTMGPLQNWASGAIAWTLATDAQFGPHLSSGGCDQCQGLVTIDKGSYRFNLAYYMMAQFSKFMPRGATVLNGTGSYTFDSGAGIESVATLNPAGDRSVAIRNTFGNDVYVTLNTTSGETWSGNVLANSLVTWILPKRMK